MVISPCANLGVFCKLCYSGSFFFNLNFPFYAKPKCLLSVSLLLESSVPHSLATGVSRLTGTASWGAELLEGADSQLHGAVKRCFLMASEWRTHSPADDGILGKCSCIPFFLAMGSEVLEMWVQTNSPQRKMLQREIPGTKLPWEPWNRLQTHQPAPDEYFPP